ELRVEGDQFPQELMPVTHLEGLHMEVADILQVMPKSTQKDYENMISRLDKVPVVEEQTEILMREGLKRHVTPVKMFMSRVPSQFDRVLTAKVEDSPIFEPFKNIRANISTEQKTQLQAQAKKVIQDKVYPALQKLKGFIVTEYI